MLDDEVNVLLTFITYRYDLITAKCSLGLAMALIPERANFLPPWECYGLLATEVDPYIRVGAFWKRIPQNGHLFDRSANLPCRKAAVFERLNSSSSGAMTNAKPGGIGKALLWRTTT